VEVRHRQQMHRSPAPTAPPAARLVLLLRRGCRAGIRGECRRRTSPKVAATHDLEARTSARGRDGFGSDTHGYEFGCHYLPHFISNSDTNTNTIEYEYKTDISNSDSHSNTYSIYNIES
jgi:hypothetical protein